ncbi:PVC-type heme-binding CxxCH protein [Alienimonas californiensis]|uniref:Cytochrome c n=1 Tax=Alienimonas californiensis TaxID=2527989 RepID=A0A517P605_9PLAN|nr:PVC-type heme-binding CxxCH protein [Alienimonas californiensis]QDT14786.1 Cytochrome c [Alienimonas californiensis]
MFGLPLAASFALACAADPSPAAADVEGPSAAEIAATLTVVPGLTVELAAAEPLVVDPVALRFDERGRAWVVEMGDYPTPPPEGFSEENPPRGRVRILEDADGDGTFDAALTFADRLAFPTGVQPWKGGAFVTLAGKVSYFPDTDRDDVADREEVWFTGFAEENEQLRANHPTLGPDGWIYVGNGLRGGKIVKGESNPSRTHASGLGEDKDAEPLDLSGRTFAFDPHIGEAKVVAGAGQYGLSIDAFGNRFFCENRKPVRHAVLPDSLTALNPHLAVESAVHDVAAWGPDSKLYPTQKAFTTSLAHAGQFTAACGVLKLPRGVLTKEYENSVFTCEPTAGLVHREVLEPQGATFTSKPARDGVEFLTSASPWFRPVDLAVGPDGSVYVVDMARAVIEHPHWMPEELKNRPDLRWGETRGRLWRVRAAGEPPWRADVLGAASPSELAGALHEPGWGGETAQRLLHERRDPAAVTPVRESNRIYWEHEDLSRGLAYLAAVGALTEGDVLHALDEMPGRAARIAADAGLMTPAALDAAVAALSEYVWEGRTAFDLCVALAPHADDPAVFAALVDAAVQSDDPYLHTAVLAGAGRAGMPTPLTAALWLSETPAPPDLLARSAEVAGRRGELTATMGMAVGSVLADRVVPEKAAAVLRGLDRGAGPALRRELAALEAGYRETLAAAFVQRSAATADRENDLFLLGLLEETWPELTAVAAEDPDPAVRSAAVRQLARTASPAAADLVRNLPAETPAVRAALLELALTAPDRAAALLTLVEDRELTAAAVGPAATRRLVQFNDEAIRTRAEAALSGGGEDRAAALARYQSALTMEGDVARGRAAFGRVCATCHAVDGVGTAVGADISDTYNRTPESLLTNILDPNRAVDVGGFAYTVLTADGRVLTGLLTSETAGSITLQSPGGETVSLPRGDLLELRSEGVSLMPTGLEEQLTPEQMADLLAFLKGWRYAE